MTDLAHYIATNLRFLRERRNLTQVELAKHCELPRPTIANLESGGANPTIKVLSKIAGALQVPIEELINKPKAEWTHYPASSLSKKVRGDATVNVLIPDKIPGIEFERMRIAAGGRMLGSPHRSGTREYLCCERGQITLFVNGDAVIAREGDVVVFRGDQKHSYVNSGKGEAVGYSVVVV
jgi:transcriptional regulator with XRE-family HTH domain